VIYIGFNVLMQGSFYLYLVSLIGGYLYVQIKSRLKEKIGFDLWPTPAILKKLVRSYLDLARGDERAFEEEEEDLS
jgi:hypothetical protein